MPRFTLIPSDQDRDDQNQEFIADDPGQLLGVIHRLGWRGADVEKDGTYLYSLSLNREGVWSIANRLR